MATKLKYCKQLWQLKEIHVSSNGIQCSKNVLLGNVMLLMLESYKSEIETAGIKQERVKNIIAQKVIQNRYVQKCFLNIQLIE